MSKKNTTESKNSSGIFSYLLKQTISAVICLAIVLAMNASDNAKIKKYASSLGYALRVEFDFDALWSSFKERIPFLEEPEQNQIEGTFQ